MDNKKRVLTACLCSFYIVSSVLTSYVTAYATAIPVVYSTWEVWEMIFLSLGITLDLADKDISEEFAGEMKDCFDLWVDSNTIDDSTKQWYKDTMANVIEQGKTGVITISNELWSTLKGWANSLYQGDIPATELTAEDTIALLNGSNMSDSVISQLEQKIESVYKAEYPNALINYNGICYFCYYNVKNAKPNWKLTLSSNNYGSVELSADYKTQFYQVTAYGSTYHATKTETSSGFGYVYPLQSDTLSCSDKCISWSAVDNLSSGTVTIICENGTLNDGVDVIFPEEDLAYDICYLPGYDLSATYANGAYDVVTSGRTWDGADVAGDVVITMPDELTTDIPFQDLYDKVVAGDIPFTDVLDDAGVIPVDTTLDRDLVGGGTISGAIVDTAINNAPTIDDTKEETDENGQTAQRDIPMTFDLSKLFPFCIPFDIIDFLGVLSAKPVAPCIEWPIQYPTLNGMETYNLKIDLSEFDEVASLLREMETLVFIVGLAGITRNHMIRG